MTSHTPDQLTSEDSTINANDVTYEGACPDCTGNANGSRTLKSTAAGDTVYKWDLHGRMVAIHTNPDADTDDLGEVSYAYNSDGVRVRQTAVTDSDNDGQLETRTTTYLNDPQNPTGYTKAIEDQEVTTGDASQAGAMDKSYILGLQVIGQADAAAVYYLILDGHGSTAALTNTSGTLVEEYAYSAFGEAIGFDANTARTNWLFGGDGIWDARSQMTYHLARCRDGHRFVSYDSFEADPSSPVALHKYLYASVNPVHMWDPSGQFTIPELLKVVAIVTVIVAIVYVPLNTYITPYFQTAASQPPTPMQQVQVDAGVRALKMWATPRNRLYRNTPATQKLGKFMSAMEKGQIEVKVFPTRVVGIFSSSALGLSNDFSNAIYVNQGVLESGDWTYMGLILFGEFQHIGEGGDMADDIAAQTELEEVRDILPTGVRSPAVNSIYHGSEDNHYHAPGFVPPR